MLFRVIIGKLIYNLSMKVFTSAAPLSKEMRKALKSPEKRKKLFESFHGSASKPVNIETEKGKSRTFVSSSFVVNVDSED